MRMKDELLVIRFQEIEETHQRVIVAQFCDIIHATKTDVMQRIFSLANPEMQLIFGGSNGMHGLKSFMISEESRKVFTIALNHYLKEAL